MGKTVYDIDAFGPFISQQRTEEPMLYALALAVFCGYNRLATDLLKYSADNSQDGNPIRIPAIRISQTVCCHTRECKMTNGTTS